MKSSTVLRHVLAALSATQAFGKEATKRAGLELGRRDAASGQYEALAQNATNPMPGMLQQTLSIPMGMLDPNDTSPSRYYMTFDDSEPDNMTTTEWRIPVSHAGCTGIRMREDDITEVIQVLMDWSDRGLGLMQKSVHVEFLADIAGWACNCKWHYWDKLSMDEFREVYQRINTYCGRNVSGWVFSKKWEKGWAWDTRCFAVNKDSIMTLCPPGCAWYGNRG
ncbi:hypothetical protein F5Y05DRAFT_380574 [Hypoxylon sp. FL0543]|nr:hypothetical protein F5Y05DRAFT_380574 [Hypoxylon sp. FL0543]